METVLIADDEKNIREGIKCIIDWEELGFKVCGEAANGEEALKLKESADALKSIIDGLEL